MKKVSIKASPRTRTSEIIPSLKHKNVVINQIKNPQQKDSTVSMPLKNSLKRNLRQEINFADYDDLLLANLQKFYSNKRNCSSVLNNTLPCGSNLCELPSDDTPLLLSEDTISQEKDGNDDSSSYLLKDNDELNLDTLAAFMSLEDSAIPDFDHINIDFALE